MRKRKKKEKECQMRMRMILLRSSRSNHIIVDYQSLLELLLLWGSIIEDDDDDDDDDNVILICMQSIPYPKSIEIKAESKGRWDI